MLGEAAFRALAVGQLVATLCLILALRLAGGSSLVGVWVCFWLFNSVRMANVLQHHVNAPQRVAGAWRRRRGQEEEEEGRGNQK
jgi:hypothetical protein